ncbi:MAG TPA: hypothetical protein VKY56_09475 [Chloroflexota bacterium]|nr:hypothetical protein [Chloroflexota bacterium]
MARKSGGKTSRARTRRSPRPAARPSAVLPVDSAVAPAGTATGPRQSGPAPSAARPAAGSLTRTLRSGSLIPITDYSYVLADLKRITVLAVGAFIILLVLTFLLH